MAYTINDATNDIWDTQGNRGIFQSGDPVYEAYLQWQQQDPENNVLEHVYEVVEKQNRTLSKVDFIDRFTEDELVAIYAAAKQEVRIEIWLDKLRVAEFISLDDPRLGAGLTQLAYIGLLSSSRVPEILA